MKNINVRFLHAVLLIALFAFTQQVFAFCTPPGWTVTCFKDGKQGIKICGENAMFGPCLVPADPPPPSGEVTPKYKIMTTVYAPPGTQGGGSTSSVSYGSQSSLGSSMSSSNSFNHNYSVTVEAKVGFLGSGGSTSGSFGYGRGTTDSEVMDIKKTASLQISRGGPAVDGIDHNRDQIWLWLGPTLDLTMEPSAGEWTVDENAVMELQYVYVGHLRNPAQMPPGVVNRLAAYGITTDDYDDILAAYAFSDESAPIDTSRFKSLYTTFPYEPPYAPGDPVSNLSFTATYSHGNVSSSSVKNEYSVGLSTSGTLNFITIFETKIKVSGKWTWTDTDTRSNTNGTSESASVTIGGPAYGYTGPTSMRVYYDVIYKTFAFAPIETGFAPGLQGSLVSRSSKALGGKEVVVIADGIKYRTFTNARGEYRFYEDFTGAGEFRFQVDGIEMAPQSLEGDTEHRVFKLP
ncbi:hypothetical protein FKG94_09070 [Exilibacterium tricleocarpae]|uniref:Carboxypeptidase regulatory-like domain-containing protein n=1 Tax=Exilibacterium tricleocarpae TaxID=2591008 RepID=A0A545TVK5_9GAMM|nr:hypothetical protein [Exilibacterium tricleocarpae]TQV81243.1 hypothetical protein FKG94_09070 [Exilibacterium tricleocarpae]